MVDLVAHLGQGSLDVNEARQERIGFDKVRRGAREVLVTQVPQAGRPEEVEAALTRPVDLGASKKGVDVPSRDKEVEALHEARSRERDRGEHADHGTVGPHGGPPAVTGRRGRVSLNHILPDRVLLESRDGARRDRRLQPGRLVQESLAQHHAREAENADRLSNPGVQLR